MYLQSRRVAERGRIVERGALLGAGASLQLHSTAWSWGRR
jgi:hypothetical protein